MYRSTAYIYKPVSGAGTAANPGKEIVIKIPARSNQAFYIACL